jgi:hypothetical protein
VKEFGLSRASVSASTRAWGFRVKRLTGSARIVRGSSNQLIHGASVAMIYDYHSINTYSLLEDCSTLPLLFPRMF